MVGYIMIDQKIAYEKHPLSQERFNELRASGLKVVDERFKPGGHVESDNSHDTKSKPKPKKRASKQTDK